MDKDPTPHFTSNTELELQLRGYHLITAEIIYRLPDHPDLLQTFLWQHLDLIPYLPRLSSFLDFWEQTIEGQLFHVKVANAAPLSQSKITHAELEIDFKRH